MDDAILRFPSASTTVEYDRERRFGRWRWHRPVRATFVFHALPLKSLDDTEQLLKAIETRRGPFTIVELCTVLIGPRAAELPSVALEAVYAAYRTANGLSDPKAPAEESTSPSEPSSDASSAGPSTSPSPTSSD